MKKLIVAVVALGAVGGMMAAGWLREPRRWSTDDAGAREAFRECLDAEMKFYHREALEACRQALNRDPDFAIAKLKVALLEGLDGEHGRELLDELRSTDLDSLQGTEAFLIRYWLLRADGDEDAAAALLGHYVGEHPDDPFALDLQCRRLWGLRDWDGAEACHEHLLEVDPNWVQAQNRRGYAAMAQGRFDEAEDHFRTYLYVAPDQANPHDSLAELLTLRGRYPEAERELEEALRIRPDFCASYEHLVTLHLLEGDATEARRALDRAATEGDCLSTDDRYGERIRCTVDLWEPLLGGDWEGVWRASEECVGRGAPDALVLGHRAALETGREDAAREIEKGVEDALRSEAEEGFGAEGASALLAHMRGARALAEGNAAEAEAQLLAADRSLRYWDVLGGAVFKLYNLAVLADAQEAAGDERAAAASREKLAGVNPRFLGRRPPTG
ncbi:MAG: tetratricopeptide repeat protein [Thermoanaerobaculia bacterium]